MKLKKSQIFLDLTGKFNVFRQYFPALDYTLCAHTFIPPAVFSA